eukprot:scaffold18292_cov60-Phaeocystis_antarctica.AAC.1
MHHDSPRGITLRDTPSDMAFAVLVLCSLHVGASEPFREPSEAKMRSQTPVQQPQGSKRARAPDLQGARSGATRLDTPVASMHPDPDSGSGPSTDRIRRRLEEAWC